MHSSSSNNVEPSASRELFFTPGAYFSGLVEDIDGARRVVKMEMYIFRLDSIGRSVLDALLRAAGRGVRLRLLIDGIGSYRDAGRIAAELRSCDCEVRIFHPLPWDFALYRRALTAGRWYSQALHFIASINHRNHRKLCLIDERVAWLGSYNITGEHANTGSAKADDYWHDTGIRVTGPALYSLVENFDSVWERKIDSIGARSRQFLASEAISRRRQPRLQLLVLLQTSRRRICITNAYFNPSPRVLKTLKRKAAEGVSVELLVPMRSDIFIFPHLSRSFYTDLLQAGIRVFEYRERILHSKTMIIDDYLIVGSTNLNYRSLLHDLELDLLVSDAAAVGRMERRFRSDIAASAEITLADWQRYPWLNKLLGLLARFLRYWI
jgi:cardiolipin synthase